jgi:hypothetical protein
LRIEGFADEFVHTGVERALPLAEECAGGQRDDREIAKMRFTADSPCGLVAVEHGHLHIHQHDIELLMLHAHGLKCGLAVRTRADDGPLLLQDALRNLQIDVAVVGHQNAHAGQPARVQLIEVRQL